VKTRLAIIGAGPIGLEAAVAARNDYDVRIYERGEVADAIRKWGHVRMFSPFRMNASDAGCAHLAHAGIALPAADALLRGTEFVEGYLAPLATHLDLPVETNVEVVAITRAAAGKMEHIAQPTRAGTPFRLLLRRGTDESFDEADLVFDCSGTFLTPNPVGDAGIPALGEERAKAAISYGIPPIDDSFADRRVLVVGGGHSAAMIVRDLSRKNKSGRITWVVRRNAQRPCIRIPNDPLIARDQLAAHANALVDSIDFKPGTVVHAIRANGEDYKVELVRRHEREIVQVDHIIAATGFRPDLNLARELQVQTCWATEGTYKLAAALLGEAGGDCLTTPAFGAETLLHPEPGYFTLGMKAYGRAPNFLIRTGLEQIRSVLEWLRLKRTRPK
jgi:thioredoxin reductase